MESRIETTFPEIGEIKDDDLREKVISSWEITLEEGGFDPLTNAPWAPHFADVAGDQSLVTHIREVTKISVSLIDCMNEIRQFSANRDHVIAGALLHDISKFFEYNEKGPTNIRELLVHPHFCVYILEKAKIPVSIQHIALSHTDRSAVKPQTIESRIVSKADWLAAEAIYWEATDEVHPRH